MYMRVGEVSAWSYSGKYFRVCVDACVLVRVVKDGRCTCLARWVVSTIADCLGERVCGWDVHVGAMEKLPIKIGVFVVSLFRTFWFSSAWHTREIRAQFLPCGGGYLPIQMTAQSWHPAVVGCGGWVGGCMCVYGGRCVHVPIQANISECVLGDARK